jgi:hypothetical protein
MPDVREKMMTARFLGGTVARTLFACLFLLLAAAPATAEDPQYPAVSPDGLQLRKTLEYGAVYLKQGADFSQYKSVGLLQCYVAFAKDWAKDYNQNEADLSEQVTPDDEARIKNGLSDAFNKVFVAELGRNGDFQIVTTQGPGVLMLRPSLLNVVVTAPDVNSPTPSADIVASAGQMTLYLELWDGGTSTLLARVIDTEADRSTGGMAQDANSVTNRAAADIILKNWADRLRKALDAARGAAPVSP